MMRALWTAATGMQGQQTNIDVIANNLANVNTVGFKRSRADFEDLIYQTQKEAGVNTTSNTVEPTGIQIGLGTQVAHVSKNFMQGSLQGTGNPLDLALQGSGFFQITMPDGTIAYTRAGDFKLDNNGRIVTTDGYPLSPEITVPQDTTSISVGNDGTISVLEAGQTTPTQIGQIQLAFFANPAGLKAIGQNLFQQTVSSGTPILGTPGINGLGTINQGYLEMSNVSVVQEMVDMIAAQRAYETNAKVIQTSDQMLQTANNLKQ
ncbi:MAG TPA: flagellar basal-body rod protein FlgG [Desulfurella acetivorans]|uniref:Flagellar basal-body rod protein FlgG n=1 Tax=Desulfurella acetivorans TaxID=33002 RepID=A0A7C6A7L2_DESAE|nr:flagellar basal-body rod protein FlgG [Desulfurella acetivorans]